jgi:hypothetical protein
LGVGLSTNTLLWPFLHMLHGRTGSHAVYSLALLL